MKTLSESLQLQEGVQMEKCLLWMENRWTRNPD